MLPTPPAWWVVGCQNGFINDIVPSFCFFSFICVPNSFVFSFASFSLFSSYYYYYYVNCIFEDLVMLIFPTQDFTRTYLQFKLSSVSLYVCLPQPYSCFAPIIWAQNQTSHAIKDKTLVAFTPKIHLSFQIWWAIHNNAISNYVVPKVVLFECLSLLFFNRIWKWKTLIKHTIIS